MKIQLLYFDDCPSWQDGLKNLETILQELNIETSIEIIKVLDDEDASRLKFLGSPSFLVDGRDLWHEERESYSLSCRVYSTPAGIRGVPTVAMLKEKLS
mgnify:FL=1|jgi:hypothetical protein